MWTTFEDFKNKCKGEGYSKGFIACNARATNEYKNRTTCAYLCDRYYNPVIKQFFIDKNVTIDEDSYRMIATAKVERYLSHERPNYKHGDEVDLLVWQKTDLGFKVIVDNLFQGLVYESQIFKPITTGNRMKGYVDHIRQDGKIDITLQPTGRQNITDFSEQLLQYLKDNGGHCDLGDKSPAELIVDRFKVSKKTYKKAVGDLYRQRLISINDDGITLL